MTLVNLSRYGRVIETGVNRDVPYSVYVMPDGKKYKASVSSSDEYNIQFVGTEFEVRYPQSDFFKNRYNNI